MLDTLTVSRTLAETGLTAAQADAIAHAVQLAAEHGDHVTLDQFNAGLAALETRLVKADPRHQFKSGEVDDWDRARGRGYDRHGSATPRLTA